MERREKLLQLFGVERPVALVTGSAAPRIGNCVARRMAACGYRVVLHANSSAEEGRRTVAELESQGAEAMLVTGDVSVSNDVDAMFADAQRRFGRVDALVNSAAIWQSKTLEETTGDDVRRHFEVNALGTFLCCRAAGLMMVEQEKGGAIINVGDWAVARPYRDFAAYFPSKGAIPAMTRSLAVELAARNPAIRVSAILPGPVMLPEDMPLAERERAIEGTLVKREGSPDNIADAVLFLAENDFVTGVCLPVDGGRSVYAP